jgi:hypothetical protein
VIPLILLGRAWLATKQEMKVGHFDRSGFGPSHRFDATQRCVGCQWASGLNLCAWMLPILHNKSG